MSEVTVETKPDKPAWLLWHELLGDLPWDKRSAWEAKGFPATIYHNGDCGFCNQLQREKGLYRTMGDRDVAEAKKMAAETVARSNEAIIRARREAMEAAAPKQLLAILDRTLDMHEKTVKAITEQTTVVNLPDPEPVQIVNNIPEQKPVIIRDDLEEETWSVDRDVLSLVDIDETARTIKRKVQA